MQSGAAPASSEVPQHPVVTLPSALASGALRVYSRTRVHARDPPPPAAGEDPTPTPVHLQLLKVRKPTDKLLPHPVIHKRSKAPASVSLPRRSRRVAGVGLCSPGPVAIESQRWVMRSLGFDCAARIDSKTQDAYFKLMGERLADCHVAAMAAIFGWSIDDSQARLGDNWDSL